jgi:hypothetical protein
MSPPALILMDNDFWEELSLIFLRYDTDAIGNEKIREGGIHRHKERRPERQQCDLINLLFF